MNEKSRKLYNLAKEVDDLRFNQLLLQEKIDELRNSTKESTDSEKSDTLKAVLNQLSAKVNGSRFESLAYLQGFRSTDPDSDLYHGYRKDDYGTSGEDISFDKLISMLKTLLKHGIDINGCHNRCKHIEHISRIIGDDYSMFKTFNTDLREIGGREQYAAYCYNKIAKQQHLYKTEIFYVLSNHYYQLNDESKNIIKRNESLHNYFKIHEKVSQKLSSNFPTVYKILSGCNEKSKDVLVSLENEDIRSQLKLEFRKYQKNHKNLCNNLILPRLFVSCYIFCALFPFYFIVDFPIVTACVVATLVIPGTYYLYYIYKLYGLSGMTNPAPFPLPDELMDYISIREKDIRKKISDGQFVVTSSQQEGERLENEDLQNIALASLIFNPECEALKLEMEVN